MGTTTYKPLAGLKVVELSTFVAAPISARMLADMGADVVKIETFRGDPWRETSKANTFTGDEENPVFDIYNAGKKSIALNIKTPEGFQVLMHMLETADVFVTNTRPASLERLGLDYESLKERFPKLIYATLTGYGEVGPDRDAPGFDTVAFWTRSGFLIDMSIKSESSYPVLNPTGSGDTVTGMNLFAGIMLALYQRDRTGKGDLVTVSLYNSGIWMLAARIIEAEDKYGMKFPKERTDVSPLSAAYRCSDGEWICITVLDYHKLAAKLFRILGVEQQIEENDIHSFAELKQKSAIVMPLFEAAFAKKTSVEWLEILKEADMVCSVMNHMRDVCNDEQAIVNNFVQDYRCHDGSICKLPCQPIRLGMVGPTFAEGTPLIGENTDEVLEQYGYTGEEIKNLHQAGAVQ